jgi:KUP system potassium uptake protein
VPRESKVSVEELGNGFYRVIARVGFMESPSVPYFLALAGEKGLEFDVDETSFFLSRERVRRGKRPRMWSWREHLFTFLLRNALGATAYYHIPPRRVIEIGTQVEL